MSKYLGVILAAGHGSRMGPFGEKVPKPIAPICNAPVITYQLGQLKSLGIDEVTDDAPFGTVEAYTRAAEYLGGFEVYAIAPLTHDESVAQVFNTHVQFMSEPTQRGERIVMWNPTTPTRPSRGHWHTLGPRM